MRLSGLGRLLSGLLMLLNAACGDPDCVFGEQLACECEPGVPGVRECGVRGEFGDCYCEAPTDAAAEASQDDTGTDDASDAQSTP